MKLVEGDLFAENISDALPTFDQIVQKHGGNIEGVDVAPNYRRDAELVIEPITGGQCVSFRDSNHQSLLTFIAGRGSGSAMTVQAAVLSGLRDIIRTRRKNNDNAVREEDKDKALKAIDAFKRDVLDKVAKDVNTKTESRAARIRAAAVIDALIDARKLLNNRLLAARAVAPEE